MDCPAFVIVRDLHTWTVQVVEWLEDADCVGDIHLIDNDSTYPPTVEWLNDCGHHVIRVSVNGGHTAPWDTGAIRDLAGDRPFIVTDPDVLPDETCPHDSIERFADALDQYPEVAKVGFSLRLDDLPEHYQHRWAVLRRQTQFWDPSRLTFDGRYYTAPVDTTMALYRPGTAYVTRPALRSAAPYTARHLTWYLDSAAPPPDVVHYRDRCSPRVGSWARERLPQRLLKQLDRPM